MEQYAILLGYFDKQIAITRRLYDEIITVNVLNYDKRFLFALRDRRKINATLIEEKSRSDFEDFPAVGILAIPARENPQ